MLQSIHPHGSVGRRAGATAAGKAPEIPQATGSGDIVVDLTFSDEESEHEASAPALRKGAFHSFPCFPKSLQYIVFSSRRP